MKIEKLKNADLNELHVRGAQLLAKLAERRGWSSLAKLPTDEALLRMLDPNSCGGTVTRSEHELLDLFRSRKTPKFFAAFDDREATVRELRNRWPHAESEILERADAVIDGKFDLLGFYGLSFGDPIDWHLEPISGKTTPLVHWSNLDFLDTEVAGDNKIIWELNRHQYFATLGQAYWLTQDEKYARAFVRHLDSWMDRNPPKQGINWASSLEVAFRSISWIWALYFFKDSPAFNAKTFRQALKFLYLNARHLETYLSTYFSPNTHLTGEALGLFYLGTFLPEFRDAQRWRNKGSEILLEQLPRHVKSDGVYFEQSSYYHRYTTDFYTHFLILRRVNGNSVPSQLTEKLIALFDHLMYIQRPDGTTPLFGDDDGGRLVMLERRPSNDFRGTLSTGAALFLRSDYKYVANEVSQETLWLLGPEGLQRLDRIAAREPASKSAAFEE
ncbi:MAG TPA: heparinase II/III family protein, partial [Pyrinomonadaceae bacterium]|nr:heparinase II/III family protein [Pyrinomonadaceae bacterium]